jgi:predicted O-methyltransferase YrrM
MTAPYLSIIATSRNDNHGGNLNLRMQVFVNSLLAQASRHKLPTELLLVDWNPPTDRPKLAQTLNWPTRHPYCSVRVIEVSPQIHSEYKHAERLPLYQMIAKNVGVRRARGEFVLCTNVDIVFSDTLFSFLAKRTLKPSICYRSDRHDTGNALDEAWFLDRTLDYCANNLIRINQFDASLNLITKQRHEIYARHATELSIGRPLLHTNGCGDFTLLSRDDWFRLRGYAEWDIFSFHLDSLFLYTAHYGGCREVVLPPDHMHYHIEHCEGWTPEIHGAGTLDRHLKNNKIERLENADLIALIQDMATRKEPLMPNDEHWGMERFTLPEISATVAEWEKSPLLSADTRNNTGPDAGMNIRLHIGPDANADKPYISLVVTTRNDDHGGNMANRFQIFMDHLNEMANRHQLPMELIVVEWNPDPARDPLAKAMNWPVSSWLRTRIVTVPPEVHAMHEHHDKFPLFQMIAKNVGVRRACGEFILATNVDLVFSDELFSFLARRELNHACSYRIDRHDIAATEIPTRFSWRKRLAFCEQNLLRVQGQFGSYDWGTTPPQGDPERLHTNACGDFTLLSREMWFRLKGYPEFHLWSIFIDGLLLHAAAAIGLRQIVLQEPCRIYHIEHDLGWAKTQAPISVRPSLDYSTQYLPLCSSMLTSGKPLNINNDNWGLADMKLNETIPCMKHDSPTRPPVGSTMARPPYAHWIDVLAAIDGRLYYRDQSAASLQSLASLAQRHAPTIIVELGTLSGLSLRTWLQATDKAHIHAVDLSFRSLHDTASYFPVDFTRVTLHEQDILSLDFARLWTKFDRVLFFIDAHDLPNVPIMEYVLRHALPLLPNGSMVVIDDLWYSPERLTQTSAQNYFDKVLLAGIDELQCFSGYYAPYHLGGSFMGFREVVPLLKFVNSYDIDLQFQPNGKHVWFEWNGATHATGITSPLPHDDQEWGVVEYNPLHIESSHPLVNRILSVAKQLYRQAKVREAANLMNDLLKKQASPEVCLALAICFSRLGGLIQAYEFASAAKKLDASNVRIERLQHDLSQRLGIDGHSKTSKKGVTIFAIPKTFTGHVEIIQKNAIRSWARLKPRPEIILFGDEPGIAEIAREVGARHVPEVARNEFGTPLVDAIFRSAAQLAKNDILAYVNADIILLNNFMAGVEKAAASQEEFLLVGRRWDFCVFDEIDFDAPDWSAPLLEAVFRVGFLHSETGLDYFVHTKGLWAGIPPFALGRCAWDNWLMKWPIVMGKTVIDATEYITAIHQDHGYAHAGERANAFSGLEPRRNRAMAGSVLGWSTDAPFHLTPEGHISKREPLPASFNSPEAKAVRVRWLIVQAGKLMAKGHHELALVKYEEAAQLQPENARIGELLTTTRGLLFNQP